MYRACQMPVAKESVSQNSTGEPSRAARSSAASWRRAISGNSFEVNVTSVQDAEGSAARAAASFSSLYSRPYSATQPVFAHTPPRRR